MSSTNQEQNRENLSTTAVTTTTTSSNTTNVAIIDPTINSNNEGDLNSSIGSNRSLNNRIFPSFRISRDIILNNVSHSYKISMSHVQ